MSGVDWDRVLAGLLHPTAAAVLGAMEAIGEPLSATDLVRVFGMTVTLSSLDYHIGRLADLGVLELARTRRRRGATEYFYRPTGGES